MPAPIAHMLISRKTRERLALKAQQESGKYPDLARFVAALEKHPKVMELGALGPDLAYFERLGVTVLEALCGKSSRPKALEPWSYQMHSKDPNVMPLKMFEIIWKESNPNNKDWDDDDHVKLAFLCGFLTHVAGDHIIHPLVNKIAGPYYVSGENRERHQACEVSQDLYLLSVKNGGRLTWQDFEKQAVQTWPGFSATPTGLTGTVLGLLLSRCGVAFERLARMFGKNWDFFWRHMPTSFRYMLHKSFVEAHGTGPQEYEIVKWGCGSMLSLHMARMVGPYRKRHPALFGIDGSIQGGDPFDTFVLLKDIPETLGHYDNYVAKAVDLSVTYIMGLCRLYESVELEDGDRESFKQVVRNADLSAPLDTDILTDAQEHLAAWEAKATKIS